MADTNNKLASSEVEAPEAKENITATDQTIQKEPPKVGQLVNTDGLGISDSSIDSAMGRLAAVDLRRVGAPVLFQVFAAWAKETTNKITFLGIENARVNKELMAAKEENAAHRAKDAERAKHGLLVTVALMFGPLLIGLGINQLAASHPDIGWPVIIVGTGILIAVLWARWGEK